MAHNLYVPTGSLIAAGTHLSMPHRAWAAFTTLMGKTLRALQLGQMISVLSKMSDTQLAQIGIKRADIQSYAEKLITHE